MNETTILIVVLATIGVAALCRRRGWPAPLVLAAVGLAVSFIPEVPHIEVSPEILLGVVLPPLLYSAALSSSYLDLRRSLHAITRLGVGAVVITAFAVAGIVVLIFPNIPLAAALVLGAVVAPPDAVSAAAVGKRLGLPRRVMTVLTGESLINDASSLTLYKVALAGVAGGAWTLSAGLKVFAVAVVVGVGVGLILGVIIHRVRLALDDPPVATMLGLAAPFAAYWIAEELAGSGVLAVVAAGLYLGHHSIEEGYATRLEEGPLWQTLDLGLETMTFALIGLQFKWLISDVLASNQGLGHALLLAVIVVVVVMLVRPLYVFATWWIDGFRLPGSPRPAHDTLSGAESTIVSWAGMRGVVTLAAAAAIPITLGGAPFPERATIQLTAYIAAIGTLLVQGTTLPWLIRRLRMANEADQRVDTAQEMRVRMLMAKAQSQVVTDSVASWSTKVGTEDAEEIAARIRDRLLAIGASAAQVFRDDASLRSLASRPPGPDANLGGESLEALTGRAGATGPVVTLNSASASDAEGRGASGLNAQQRAAMKKLKKARATGRMVQQVRRELIAAQRTVLRQERDAGNLNEVVARRLLHEIDISEESLSSSWMAHAAPLKLTALVSDSAPDEVVDAGGTPPETTRQAAGLEESADAGDT